VVWVRYAFVAALVAVLAARLARSRWQRRRGIVRFLRVYAAYFLLITAIIAAGYGILASEAPASPSAGKAGGRPVGALVTPSAAAPGPSPLASIPDAMRAPGPSKPGETTVAVARPPGVTPEPPRPRPELRPTPRPVKPEPAVEFPWPSPTVTGKVLDNERKPLAGASVVVRGVEVRTDADGGFRFRTVVPRYYPIPTDGPVGELLRATGRHPYRPAHIHFLVGADGYHPVATHLFVADSPYLDSDAVFGVKASLVREFRRVDGPDPYRTVHFDIVLRRR